MNVPLITQAMNVSLVNYVYCSPGKFLKLAPMAAFYKGEKRCHLGNTPKKLDLLSCLNH